MKKIMKLTAVLLLAAALIISGLFFVALLNGALDNPREIIPVCLALVLCAVTGLQLLLSASPKEKRRGIVTFVLSILLIVYFFALFFTLFGNRDRLVIIRVGDARLSLRPFHTTKSFLKAYKKGAIETSAVVSNLMGNFILFMPMALLLPLLFKKLRKLLRYAGLLLLMIVLVEVMQYLTMRGTMDIDDVILNFTGTIVAFVVIWSRLGRAVLRKLGWIEA